MSGLFADAVTAVGFGIAAMVGQVGGNGIELGVEAVKPGVVAIEPGVDAVESGVDAVESGVVTIDPFGEVIDLDLEDRDPLFDAFEPIFDPTETLVQSLLTFDDQIEFVLDIFGKGAYASGEEFIDLLQELFVHGGPPRELS